MNGAGQWRYRYELSYWYPEVTDMNGAGHYSRISRIWTGLATGSRMLLLWPEPGTGSRMSRIWTNPADVTDIYRDVTDMNEATYCRMSHSAKFLPPVRDIIFLKSAHYYYYYARRCLTSDRPVLHVDFGILAVKNWRLGLSAFVRGVRDQLRVHNVSATRRRLWYEPDVMDNAGENKLCNVKAVPDKCKGS